MRIRGQEVLEPKQRLQSNCVADAVSGCWNWTASANRQGYGRLTIGSRSDGTRRKVGAHVYSFLVFKGIEIPVGYECCHSCDNPRCINPDHLFVGTRQDNVDDRQRKGRNVIVRGERHGISKLTTQKVAEIRARKAAGETNRSLAKVFGVHYTTIGDVVNLKYWLPTPPSVQEEKGSSV